MLDDLTSSYVEGAAPKSPMMHRGYSRDHRPDCLQVVLAVIVNIDGFPLSDETFDGNRADVTTRETVQRMAERRVKIWYDSEGDFLEVIFDSKPGHFHETSNDQVMEKVDDKGNILGCSVLKVSALKQAPLEVAL